MEVVGVKFNLNSQIYSFDPKGLKLAEGDKVIVETSRGIEWGEIKSLKNVPEDQIAFELKPVLRKVTESDEKQITNNIADAKAAIPKIKEKADELNLPMIIKNLNSLSTTLLMIGFLFKTLLNTLLVCSKQE